MSCYEYNDSTMIYVCHILRWVFFSSLKMACTIAYSLFIKNTTQSFHKRYILFAMTNINIFISHNQFISNKNYLLLALSREISSSVIAFALSKSVLSLLTSSILYFCKKSGCTIVLRATGSTRDGSTS